MDGPQPWLGLVITAILNTVFATVAGAVMSLWVLARSGSAWSRSRFEATATVLNRALAASVLTFALLLWTQTAAFAELPLLSALGSIGAVVRGTRFGHAWVIGTAVLVLTLGFARSRRGWSGPGPFLRASTACVVLFAAAKSWTSHAGASGALLPFVVDWVHLVSVSVWAGAVFIGAGVVLRAPQPVGLAERGTCASYIQALSTTATWSLAAVLVTGVFTVWRGLNGEASLLFSSSYGAVLVTKLVLVALAVALGAQNRFFVMPRLLKELRAPEPSSSPSPPTFHRVLCVESLVLVAVFCAAAALSSSAPPSAPSYSLESVP